MYLKELRINGFKSFADGTVINLTPGVTSVVGPNGCGKSNIADAIRWVLGEQSAKSLRAGQMQDVIFQGTDSRKAVNLCEVALVFTECEEELGTAYNEVEVVRRLSRDISSEYLLNGNACRLKDIHRLFLDTGVGRVSYSFMLQGQIDQILSTNPEERRSIFEEAAGISKYKAQRREALNKLSLVDTNLARVSDVTEEVMRQIGSLRRQAGKALRYKRIKRRLNHLDLSVQARAWGDLRGTVGAAETEAVALRKKSEALNRILQGREKELERWRIEKSELYETLRDAQQRMFDLKSEKEQSENRAELAAIRTSDIEKRISEIRIEITDIEKDQKLLEEQAKGDFRIKEEQLNLVFTSDDLFSTENQELSSLVSDLDKVESDLEKRRGKLEVTESNIPRLRSKCTSLEVKLQTFQIERGKFSDEIHSSEEERMRLLSEQQDIEKTLKAGKKQSEKEETNLSERQREWEELQIAYRNLQSEIQQAERTIAEQAAQISLIENLEERFEGYGDGAKALLEGKLDDLLEKDSFRILSKFLHIDSGYTKAMVSLLGPAVDTMVLDDPDTITPIIDRLDDRKLGRVCLQITAPPRLIGEIPNFPIWLKPAKDIVRAREPEMQGYLSVLLEDCYFCDEISEFLDYWRENPEFEFIFVATRNGELIDRRGLFFGGHKAGQGDTFLQRAERVKLLREGKEKAEMDRDGLRDRAQRLLKQLEEKEANIESKRKLLLEISQEVSLAQGQNIGVRENLERNSYRIEEARTQLNRLEQSREILESERTNAHQDLKTAESEIETLKKAAANEEISAEELRSERDRRREKLSDVRLDLAERKQKLESIERKLDEIERQSSEIGGLLVKRRQEVDTFLEQAELLKMESKEQEKRAGEVEKTLDVTLASVETDRGKLLRAESETKRLEEALGEERSEHNKLETELNKIEIRIAETNTELRFLQEKARREYEIDLDRIDWKHELWEAGDELKERVQLDLDDESVLGEEEPKRKEPSEEDLQSIELTDWAIVCKEVEILRERITTMGPVNLIAIEEYRELKDRHSFLTEQSNDLWRSKEQLLAAIDEINKTSQAMFQATFGKIRENFIFTFSKLFGGGHSDLELVDKEDVLESGIEITARPPGTRLKTLALLSGGQKTMTAVALLFAIYMVKPSPFCLLDELDAPLDDANIGRFVSMLQKFTEFSQFIIITHNKRTIASSDSIFGVTMQEKGVSKLVSMRFNVESGRTEEVGANRESSVES
tara:strand:- start:14023 stop:17745 length:3723 start_codon:yes stop_codon:yes gene_type:complete